MRRLPLALLVLLITTFTRSSDAEDIFVLLTGYGAKETCSCVFVAGQSDDYCKVFGQGDPTFTVALSIDRSQKTVVASIGTTSRTARFADGDGCTLDGM